jgi:plasmid stabilization system protein ParE
VHNPRKEKALQRDQTVAEMVEEVLARQAKSLADRSGQSLENALEVVADTEAARQLRELANGEHRHEKAQDWQASVLWERAEERLMHLIASDALSRFAADRHYSRVEGYMEWLEGKEERAQYHALLEEELASLRG